jgi:hypothetical protein
VSLFTAPAHLCIELEEAIPPPSLCIPFQTLLDVPLPASSDPYLFRHTPPSHIRGRRRWPGDTDYQTHLAAPHPTFLDIWSKIPTDYFSSSELAICKCLASDYQFGPSFTSVTLNRPWHPLRRRRWGFGIPSTQRSLSVEVPVFTMVFHNV